MVSSTALPLDTRRTEFVNFPNPGRSACHSPASVLSCSKASVEPSSELAALVQIPKVAIKISVLTSAKNRMRRSYLRRRPPVIRRRRAGFSNMDDPNRNARANPSAAPTAGTYRSGAGRPPCSKSCSCRTASERSRAWLRSTNSRDRAARARRKVLVSMARVTERCIGRQSRGMLTGGASNYTCFNCGQHCQRPIPNRHFRKNAGNLIFDRTLGGLQRLSDLSVRQPSGHQP
jgi:hypothetical protein